MNNTEDEIIELFYLTDDFCIEFDKNTNGHLLANKPKRKPKISTSKVMTIMILFHFGQFHNLKHFYVGYVQKHLSSYFPNKVS